MLTTPNCCCFGHRAEKSSIKKIPKFPQNKTNQPTDDPSTPSDYIDKKNRVLLGKKNQKN